MKPKRYFGGGTLLFILFRLLLCFDATFGGQEFEEQPSDITVTRGAPVNFPCKVKDLKGTLQWTMDGFGLGTDRELKAFPRFMMIGSNETGKLSFFYLSAFFLSIISIIYLIISILVGIFFFN